MTSYQENCAQRSSPQIVGPLFHGSLETELTSFNLGHLGTHKRDLLSGLGFHFTPDRRMAETLFAMDFRTGRYGRVYEACLSVKNPLVIDETQLVAKMLDFAVGTGHLSPARARTLKKLPYMFMVGANPGRYQVAEIWKLAHQKKIDPLTIASAFRTQLRASGFDAIQYINQVEWAGDGRKDWIALDPRQILFC